MPYHYPPDSDSYVLGVPARDLSDAEYRALSPEEQALVRAIYVHQPAQKTPAPAEGEK